MKRKLTALVLCACLCLTLLAGCGGSKIAYYSADDSSESSQNNIYDADTVVCTANGSDITWEEYYYWLKYYSDALESSYGEITDWTAASAYDASRTNNQVVLDMAQTKMLNYHMLLAKAQEDGLSVSDEELESQITSGFDKDSDGTLSTEEEQTFESYLTQNSASRSLYNTILRENLTAQSLFDKYTQDYTDDDVLAWAKDQGYMAAKHILFLTVDTSSQDSDTGAYTPLSDDEIAAAKTQADDVYAQLQAVAGDTTALTELYDKLMNEYSEDTGLQSFPDGYCFQDGDMVAIFGDTVKSLDENYGLSGVVQSDYGYHIIMRIPLDPDMTVDYTTSSSSSTGTAITLRDYFLNDAFNTQAEQWAANMQTTWSEGFETLDLSTIF